MSEQIFTVLFLFNSKSSNQNFLQLHLRLPGVVLWLPDHATGTKKSHTSAFPEMAADLLPWVGGTLTCGGKAALPPTL